GREACAAAGRAQAIAFGGPDGIERSAEIGAELARLSAAAFDHEDARGAGQEALAFAAGPIGDPAAVGREVRSAAAGHEERGLAAHRRYDVDAAAIAFAAEGDAGAVWGDA